MIVFRTTTGCLLLTLNHLSATSVTFGQGLRSADEIRETLNAPLELDLLSVPLQHAVELLSERLRFPVVLDPRGLQEAGVTADTPLTLRIRRVSAATVLREMLRPVQLTYVVRPGGLGITSERFAVGPTLARGYPVEDLVGRDGRHVRDLIEQIESCVAPNSWKQVGGAGDLTYEMARHRLVALQTPAVHRGIAEHLEKLRAARRPSPAGPQQSPASVAAIAEKAMLTKSDVLGVLEAPANLDYAKRPLGAVLDDIESRLGVSIVPDRAALEEERVGLDTPVTLRLNRVTYKAGLEVLLRDLDLEFVVREGFIAVASRRLRTELEQEFHAIADLVRDREDATVLEDLLRSCVVPNAWGQVGGAGSIWYDAPGKLWLVSQSQAGHESVVWWLDRLRQARRRAKEELPYDPAAWARPGPRPGGTLTQADVLAKLEQPVSVSFRGTPFEQALASIEKQCGVSFALNHTALEEEHVTPETPVTLELHQVRAKSALRLLLGELELAYSVGDGYVWITGRVQLSSEMRCEFYPIGELARSPVQVQAITELIEKTVAPNSWSTIGGPGDLWADARGRVLLIKQPEAIHEQIADLLSQFRSRGR